MITSLFWTLAGLVGAGGGLWVAALFLPSLAQLLKATLDFLRSPLGTIIGVAVLGMVLFSSGWIAGDIAGRSSTRAAWRLADEVRAKAEAARLDALKADMHREADTAVADDDAFTQSIDKKVAQHDTETTDRAGCAATDADIRRLLSIR